VGTWRGRVAPVTEGKLIAQAWLGEKMNELFLVVFTAAETTLKSVHMQFDIAYSDPCRNRC